MIPVKLFHDAIDAYFNADPNYQRVEAIAYRMLTPRIMIADIGPGAPCAGMGCALVVQVGEDSDPRMEVIHMPQSAWAPAIT